MPTESDLRDLLREPAPGTGGIDVDAVLRRARSRRRPRVIATAAAGALALAGVLVPVTLTTMLDTGTPTTFVADEAAGGSAGGDAQNSDAEDSDAAAPESATGPTAPDALGEEPPVLFSTTEAPWRIAVVDSQLGGDPTGCTTDPAVAVSEADGAGLPIAIELVPGSTRDDAARIASCLADVLRGGQITVTGPE